MREEFGLIFWLASSIEIKPPAGQRPSNLNIFDKFDSIDEFKQLTGKKFEKEYLLRKALMSCARLKTFGYS